MLINEAIVKVGKQQSAMQSAQSTVDNSSCWKLFHGFDIFFGGGTFFIGSIILLPFFTSELDVPEVSGWLYSIGSATFVAADTLEWYHYVKSDCRFQYLAINFFINVCSSLLYLIGSITFIPQIGLFDLGMDLFIWGSALNMIAQTWKLLRFFTQKNKSCGQCYKQDVSGFWTDFFSDLGGLMFFVGTFIYKGASDNHDFADIAAWLYSVGGLFFLLSSIFVVKKYFWEKNPAEKQESNYSVVTDI